MERFAGLAADVEGDEDHRPPLVLLNGLTFDRTMWRLPLDELAKVYPGRRVVAFDLPGHGDSDVQARNNLDSVTATLQAAIEDASLDQPVVVGHSIGAVIGSAYAAQYPTRGVVNVDQPLLIAPFAELVRSVQGQLRGPNFAEVWAMFAASFHTELLPEAAQEIVAGTSRPRQDLVLGYWQDVIELPIVSLTAMVEDGLTQIRETNLPYVIVAGTELDPAYEQWLHAQLPQAHVVILPASGHFPHLAHPAPFARILADTASW